MAVSILALPPLPFARVSSLIKGLASAGVDRTEGRSTGGEQCHEKPSLATTRIRHSRNYLDGDSACERDKIGGPSGWPVSTSTFPCDKLPAILELSGSRYTAALIRT